MKKLIFTALLSLMVVGVYAQKKTYKAAKKAFAKKEYAQALELATQASQNPDTQDNADVYTIIGKSNMYLFEQNLTDLSLANKAYEAFQTASEKGGDKLREELMEAPFLNANNQRLAGGEGFIFLQTMVNRQGNIHFEAEEFEKAYEYFLLSSKIVPDDIVINFFVGYCAYGAENNEAAIEYYKKVIELNEELPEGETFENTKYAFNGLIDIYFGRQENYDKALEYVQLAKETYPEDKLYKDYEIDILIKSDRMDEAIDGLKKITSAGGAPKGTYYTLGFLYLNSGQYKEASKIIEEALALDPNYYDALYVAGSAHFNQGVDFTKEANDAEDDADYKRLKDAAVAKFKDALPFFERAVAEKGDDLYSLNPLSTIYDQLGMDDKRDEILKKIEELGG